MPQESKNDCPEPAQAQQAEATAPQKSLGRPSAKEIFTEVATNARRELSRSDLALGISGIGGGVVLVAVLEYGQVIFAEESEED